MRHSLVPAAAIVWVLTQGAVLAIQPQALAATASQVYKDIPPGHWAEAAVTQVAVDRHFMRGYPDGTFKGDQPFTRLQLALAVSELVKELEAISKTDWSTHGLGGYAFQDLPGDPETRAIVLRMANDYRLFEGVPGVTSQTLEAEKQVTRYEMAKVVHRLMRLGEERHLVDPSVQRPQLHLFTDVPPSAWAYNEVKEVADRYQVMVGFPDATFRGPEELTRYQFAASAAQTFPMVRELVQRTQERNQPKQAAQAVPRFLESAPLALGVTARFNGPVGPALNARYAHYFGSPFFALGDANVGTQNTAGDRLYNAGLSIGWAFPLGPIAHVQPYLGGRLVSTGSDTAGGVTYGAVAYARPLDNWGFFLNAGGTSLLGTTNGMTAQGTFLGAASAGAEYYLTQRLGLTAELGYSYLPANLTAKTGALGTEGALLGTVGVVLGW